MKSKGRKTKNMKSKGMKLEIMQSDYKSYLKVLSGVNIVLAASVILNQYFILNAEAWNVIDPLLVIFLVLSAIALLKFKLM